MRGLSPLTRGNRPGRRRWPTRQGPIPAHAGQPYRIKRDDGSITGLSPLTRGNLQLGHWRILLPGPIPAHAGQPPPAPVGVHRHGAYPRSRGATSSLDTGASSFRGLSPLTRGNQPDTTFTSAASGPIPAHAGQPKSNPPLRILRRAYPRSRGATDRLQQIVAQSWGLSPLTRGNLPTLSGILVSLGPIPAHAGQPCRRSQRPPPSRAYPRSRGATVLRSRPSWLVAGLSPLTRGNR